MRLRNGNKLTNPTTEPTNNAVNDQTVSKSADTIPISNSKSQSVEPVDTPQPLLEDNHYQCNICKYEIEGYRAYVFHLKMVHKMHFIKKLIQKHWLQVDEHDPPFNCQRCGKQFKTARHYEMHLGSIHKFDFLATVNKMIMPNSSDPNNYCQACEDTYSNKNNFKAHLRKVHGMTIINKNLTVVPDPYDPDFNCQTCEKKYENKKKFRKHLYSIHNIRGVRDKKATELKSNDSNSTASSLSESAEDSGADMTEEREKDEDECTIATSSGSLSGILRTSPESDNPLKSNVEKEVASITVKKRKAAFSSALKPVIDDPDFFCRACEKTYSNKYGYRVHLEHVHDIKPPQAANKPMIVDPAQLLPDPHDPDFHCRVCKVTQQSLTEHRYHCRIVHNMVFELRFKNPDAVIDIDCPNFYCPKCEKTFEGKYYYRSHLKSVHEIIYKQAKKRATNDVEIDIDSPDFYCAKCEKKFTEKYYFRRHLKYVHSLRYKHAKLDQKTERRRVRFAENIDDTD